MHRVTPPHGENPLKTRLTAAFTLIEMSIVLVVIGLVVGGILMGRDLISAAGVTAQISQIGQYNAAVHNFQSQYNGLPGDLSARVAAQYGFVARAGVQGRGDGNGLIEAFNYTAGVWANYGGLAGGMPGIMTGEPLLFWVDLSSADLIGPNFNTATDANVPTTITAASVPNLAAFLPSAKIGNNNYVSVYSYYGVNYFMLSGMSSIQQVYGYTYSTLALTVQQAYNIDQKIDDGLPTSGNVQANYAAGYNSPFFFAATNAASPSATTCYDTTSNQYSMSKNAGNGLNCALSFQFQ